MRNLGGDRGQDAGRDVPDFANMPESRLRALYAIEQANPVAQMVGVFQESTRLIQTGGVAELPTYLETKAAEFNTILETAYPERAGMGITPRYPVGLKDVPEISADVLREIFLGEKAKTALSTVESQGGRAASLLAVCVLLLSAADEIRGRT